jgi:hypothetical protein
MKNIQLLSFFSILGLLSATIWPQDRLGNYIAHCQRTSDFRLLGMPEEIESATLSSIKSNANELFGLLCGADADLTAKRRSTIAILDKYKGSIQSFETLIKGLCIEAYATEMYGRYTTEISYVKCPDISFAQPGSRIKLFQLQNEFKKIVYLNKKDNILKSKPEKGTVEFDPENACYYYRAPKETCTVAFETIVNNIPKQFNIDVKNEPKLPRRQDSDSTHAAITLDSTATVLIEGKDLDKADSVIKINKIAYKAQLFPGYMKVTLNPQQILEEGNEIEMNSRKGKIVISDSMIALPAPQIRSVSPQVGFAMQEFTLNGNNFSLNSKRNKILLIDSARSDTFRCTAYQSYAGKLHFLYQGNKKLLPGPKNIIIENKWGRSATGTVLKIEHSPQNPLFSLWMLEPIVNIGLSVFGILQAVNNYNMEMNHYNEIHSIFEKIFQEANSALEVNPTKSNVDARTQANNNLKALKKPDISYRNSICISISISSGSWLASWIVRQVKEWKKYRNYLKQCEQRDTLWEDK